MRFRVTVHIEETYTVEVADYGFPPGNLSSDDIDEMLAIDKRNYCDDLAGSIPFNDSDITVEHLQ